ncbi:MAG: hypothetical protein AAF967_14370, partial [Pseudomonadota bacterium]
QLQGIGGASLSHFKLLRFAPSSFGFAVCLSLLFGFQNPKAVCDLFRGKLLCLVNIGQSISLTEFLAHLLGFDSNIAGDGILLAFVIDWPDPVRWSNGSVRLGRLAGLMPPHLDSKAA